MTRLGDFLHFGQPFKARFKPTSHDKSGVDGGVTQVPTFLLN